MFSKGAFSAAILMASASPLAAQGFSGGELSIEALAFADGNDWGYTTYSASLEYTLTRDISIAGDLSFYDFNSLDLGVGNFTVHGIYHLSNVMSAGVFIGQDGRDDEGDDLTFIGVEGGYETGRLLFEGYAAQDGGGDDATVAAIDAEYIFNDEVTLLAEVGLVDFEDELVTRLSLGGQYAFLRGPEVYGEIGSVTSDDEDEIFIGAGARIEFGAARGTTFDRRSLFDVLPGF